MFASLKSVKTGGALLGLATAVVAMGATVGVAEAKHKKHFGVVIDLGGPYYGSYGSYYGGYDSCRWLKRRAIHTGSPYWWKRYHYCIYG